MCRLTADPAITYQYKMDYLCSFTMALLPRQNAKADSMETLCFYDDPELLFDLFGALSEAQRDEVLRMMITVNILQMQPTAFFLDYKKATGIDLQENEDTLNTFCYKLKPAVCLSLAKTFYSNLTDLAERQSVGERDICFLINLFEGHLDQHLDFDSESKREINQPFIKGYTVLRQAFLSAMHLENRYSEYSILSGKETLAAKMEFLDTEKREFLIERARWLQERGGLGVKVE